MKVIGSKSLPRYKNLGVFYIEIYVKQVSDLGGFTLLSDYVTLPQLLSLAYPHYDWGIFQIKSKEPLYKKSQHLLKTMLKTNFPSDGFHLFFSL